jgi:hypothetical protein
MAQPNNDQSNGTPGGTSRLTGPEAAQALGISPEAVRNRLSRGTLDSVKENGRVFVLIDRDMAQDAADRPGGTPRDTADTPTDILDGTPTTEGEAAERVAEAKDETIRVLKDQLEAEREANRENRRIIAGLVQRVPELEASPEARESAVSASEARGEGDVASEPEQRRSWLYRFFFGK